MPTKSATKSESAFEELRKLDFMFALDETSTITEAVESISSRIARPPNKNHLVSGYLLPKNESAPFRLWFHVDQTEEDKRMKCFFCHLSFAVTDQRTDSASELRNKGMTVEWLLSELASASANKVVDVIAEAELRLKGRHRTPKSVKSEPLHVGASTLELCGVEYRSTVKITNGLREFRWSDSAKIHRNIWLNYNSSWDWSQPWDQERKRCLDYLKELL